MNDARKPASKTFSDEEKAAMKERAREQKAETRAMSDKAGGEAEVLAKIAEMSGSDRTLATRMHALIKASAPTLAPKTWYGMPAYARDGKVVCFFQPAEKFKTRYSTLGTVVTRSRLNSRSRRSCTISMCSNPRKPQRNPKPSAC